MDILKEFCREHFYFCVFIKTLLIIFVQFGVTTFQFWLVGRFDLSDVLMLAAIVVISVDLILLLEEIWKLNKLLDEWIDDCEMFPWDCHNDR